MGQVGRGLLLLAMVVLAVTLGIAGSALGYMSALRALRTNPPALAYVNVTGAVARGGELVVTLNVSAERGVEVLNGTLGLFRYGLLTHFRPAAGEVNVTLPLLPQLLSAGYVYVIGNITITYKGARGLVTFTKLVPIITVLYINITNVSWSYSPPYIAVSLNYSFPYSATVNVSGELVSNSAQPPVGVIALGPTCWGTVALPPGSGLVAVSLTHCSIVIPLRGKYMTSWYFEGQANVTFSTPAGPISKVYFLYLYHGGSGS